MSERAQALIVQVLLVAGALAPIGIICALGLARGRRKEPDELAAVYSAVIAAREVYRVPWFLAWASLWVSGEDRSYQSADAARNQIVHADLRQHAVATAYLAAAAARLLATTPSVQTSLILAVAQAAAKEAEAANATD